MVAIFKQTICIYTEIGDDVPTFSHRKDKYQFNRQVVYLLTVWSPDVSTQQLTKNCDKSVMGDKIITIAVICVTKSRTGDYDFRACARARGFRGSTFSVGRIRFAVCAERSRDKTCVF